MPRRKIENVRAIYDEFAKGNLRAGFEHYDPDVVLIVREGVPDAGRRYLGVDGIREFMLAWLKPWTNFTMTAEELIEAGDSVVVGVRQRAIGQDSGIPVEMTYSEVWTFRGDFVICIHQYDDRSSALEAAGLSE